MAQIKKARLSQMWYSCQRWLLLASELSCSGKASQEASIQLSSRCRPRVIMRTPPQTGPVNDSSLRDGVVMTLFAKIRQAHAKHTHLGFVQPWQNLSKLNYEAICHIFDVIKIEAPRWNVHRPAALRATANAP